MEVLSRATPDVVRAIIVEDEFIVAADIQATLTRMGYVVVGHCATVESCIEKAAQLRPHLVIMDINFGGRMQGVDAAIELRRRFALPVVFLTAYADDDTLRRAQEAEPAGFLVKPYRPSDLRVTIEMALHKHRLQASAERSARQAHIEEERFRALFEWGGLGIALLDATGQVLESNHTLLRMLGAATLRDRSLESLSAESFAAEERRRFDELMAGERQHYDMETRYLRASGELGWGGVTVTLLPSDTERVAVRFLSDISPRRLTQVAEFQQNERRLLAAEIHDTISRPLAGIFYQLQLAERLRERDPDSVEGPLAAARSQAQNLLEEVSKLMDTLRTPPLDSTSALAAVRDAVARTRDELGIPIALTMPTSTPPLGTLASFFLYRIIEEALVNVRRHAEAKCAEVRLEVNGPWLEGVVSDDGLGAAAVCDPHRPHHGIRCMRDRAELIGGWLEVTLDRGARVAFRIPLEGKPHD